MNRKKAPKSTPTAAELLDQLRAEVPTNDPTPSGKGKDRYVISCETEEEREILDSLSGSDAVLKVVSGKHEASSDRATEIFVRKHLENSVRAGEMLPNPILQSEKSRANLVVKHIKNPKLVGKDGKPPNIQEAMEERGFSRGEAAKVMGMVQVRESVGVKKFTDLTGEKASAEQQEVARKLMAFIKEQLSVKERALVLEKVISYEVSEGWKQVAVEIASSGVKVNDPNYVEKATDRLEKLFEVISPQFVISQMNFSGELQQAFTEIQTSVNETDFDSPDGKYRAKINGNEVQLFTLKEGVETFVKTKQCRNINHCQNTIQKWWQDPAYLLGFVVGTND